MIKSCKIHKEQTEVRMVQPIKSTDSCDSDDDKREVETEHLSTYRTIWRVIDLLECVIGFSVYNEVEINVRLVFVSAMICCAYTCLFYTMAVVWPSVPMLIEVVCMFGMLFPVCLGVWEKQIKFNRN